jgi:hypothetical protein
MSELPRRFGDGGRMRPRAVLKETVLKEMAGLPLVPRHLQPNRPGTQAPAAEPAHCLRARSISTRRWSVMAGYAPVRWRRPRWFFPLVLVVADSLVVGLLIGFIGVSVFSGWDASAASQAGKPVPVQVVRGRTATFTVAYNTSGISRQASSAQATTAADPQVPGAPGTLTGSGCTIIWEESGCTVNISWGAASGTVTGYDVYLDGSLFSTTTGTAFSTSFPTVGGRTFYVEAYNSAGNGPASNTVDVYVTKSGPPPVSLDKPITPAVQHSSTPRRLG